MKKLFTSTIFIISIFLLAAPASASPIWGTDASDELTGSRDSNGGITATAGWADGAFNLSWVISEDNGTWTYEYTVNTVQKDISHFILEVTEDGNPFTFEVGDGTDATIDDPPGTWSENGSNPDMPNPIYGIKFDFTEPLSLEQTFTIITDRAPVYGVFYAKDGTDNQGAVDVVAWSNALNFADYMTKTEEFDFTTADYIVRPDSVGVIPVPGTVLLLGSGLIVLAGIRKRFKS